MKAHLIPPPVVHQGMPRQAGLYSEAVVIEAQARQAQPLKGGENLLAKV